MSRICQFSGNKNVYVCYVVIRMQNKFILMDIYYVISEVDYPV